MYVCMYVCMYVYMSVVCLKKGTDTSQSIWTMDMGFNPSIDWNARTSAVVYGDLTK